MKKIRKTSVRTAQSVFSFYCPCSGYCSTYCYCTTPDSATYSYEGALIQNNPNETTTV